MLLVVKNNHLLWNCELCMTRSTQNEWLNARYGVTFQNCSNLHSFSEYIYYNTYIVLCQIYWKKFSNLFCSLFQVNMSTQSETVPVWVPTPLRYAFSFFYIFTWSSAFPTVKNRWENSLNAFCHLYMWLALFTGIFFIIMDSMYISWTNLETRYFYPFFW